MLRTIYRKVRRRIAQASVQRQRQKGELKSPDWQTDLVEENDFWASALADPERCWNISEYRERINPDFALQPELRALIPAPAGATVRILDVGAGPLTRVGKKWAGRRIEITATDALADKYDALIKRLNVPALVPVQMVHAEKLTETFPENHFDLAYASNCLDHAYDPVLAIRQMLMVVKAGHYAYLWHFANAGKVECYQGLHQWNFDVEKGKFIISDGRAVFSLAAEIGAMAEEITCEETQAFDNRVVIARIKKNGRVPV